MNAPIHDQFTEQQVKDGMNNLDPQPLTTKEREYLDKYRAEVTYTENDIDHPILTIISEVDPASPKIPTIENAHGETTFPGFDEDGIDEITLRTLQTKYPGYQFIIQDNTIYCMVPAIQTEDNEHSPNYDFDDFTLTKDINSALCNLDLDITEYHIRLVYDKLDNTHYFFTILNIME